MVIGGNYPDKSYIIKVGIPLGSNIFNVFSRWYGRAHVDWGFLAVAVSNSQIDLTWTDNYTDEDNFVIERSLNGETWSVINSPVADEVSYSNIGLDAETKYYYRIRAKKGSHYTAYSPISSATTTK